MYVHITRHGYFECEQKGLEPRLQPAVSRLLIPTRIDAHANVYLGTDAGPSSELVTQMMEEALKQDDRHSFNKERSG